MDDVSSVTSSTNADMESGKPSSFIERANKSGYAQSEDGSMGYPSGSSPRRSSMGSQFQEFPSSHYGVHDGSPRAVESPRYFEYPFSTSLSDHEISSSLIILLDLSPTFIFYFNPTYPYRSSV